MCQARKFSTMINPKKLVRMARKWQRLAALNRKRIGLPRGGEDTNRSTNHPSPVAEKGHFVVYTADQARFVFPLSYLSSQIFSELLRMSEEEFGLPRDGPIMLPCDAVSLKYIVSFMQKRIDKNMERALLVSISSSRCETSSSLHQEQSIQQLLVSSF